MVKVYQIGMPIEKISTVVMLWDAYNQPCNLVIRKAKNPELVILEVTHDLLTNEIIKTIPDALLKIKKV